MKALAPLYMYLKSQHMKKRNGDCFMTAQSSFSPTPTPASTCKHLLHRCQWKDKKHHKGALWHTTFQHFGIIMNGYTKREQLYLTRKSNKDQGYTVDARSDKNMRYKRYSQKQLWDLLRWKRSLSFHKKEKKIQANWFLKNKEVAAAQEKKHRRLMGAIDHKEKKQACAGWTLKYPILLIHVATNKTSQLNYNCFVTVLED